MADIGTRVLLAPAKINLGLRILGRRPDGYHELVSLVAFADLHDRITVSAATGEEDGLTVAGTFVRALDSDNLILRAISGFRGIEPGLPALRIHLEKSIPVAAGLGGGSADAAAMLRFLAGLSGRDPMENDIRRLAASLGADVPVCLDPRSRIMRGTGIDLDAPADDFAPQPVLLVNPGVPVPTGAVFGALDAGPVPADTAKAETGPLDRNDLEAPACRIAPEITDVLTFLRELPGVAAARLSGSGATCFALFETEAGRDQATRRAEAAHPDWWLHAGMLRNWAADELDLPA
ncbi:MAG: 4-(cytidine 5'-diphospho)-2-C-methyl-D-erythritol kinase [Nisaea sp.]|uniref:4-(cytidine 5'-diphospho)-2-C-methyl-D-erythritol kinase n=1 Tax=Nisaea sp. TaxID=2024842 RepID=UPI001B0BBB11|nr:4-(cytidine 5'-diphospho)-2-C-methyl-D-erythritol kinase [Nisaea sp.]MBO6561668.1 4-(cytidine 5'-diphospho)-2-C-methyl-D-erythritol kinase [Nisaea sp.]